MHYTEIKPPLQEKEHEVKFISKNQFNAKLQSHLPKNNETGGGKPPKIMIKMKKKEYLPDVQALHLPFIFLDV